MSVGVFDEASIDPTDVTKHGRKRTIEEYLGGGLMLGMVAILVVQVISRSIFQSSLSWSEELARYMFIWLIFLCLGAVTLRGEHIAIDMATQRLPLPARRVVTQIGLVIMAIVNVVILLKAFQLAYIIQDLGQASPALNLPMWTVYAAVPIGLTIATLRAVQASIRLWRGDTTLLGEHLEGK